MKNFYNKNSTIIGWILSGILCIMLVLSAIGKLTANADVIDMFEKMNLMDWLKIIGVGELISALLFLFPKTNFYGVLLLSAYFGGAIVAHMTSGESFILPAGILVFVWLVGYIRNPNLFPKRN